MLRRLLPACCLLGAALLNTACASAWAIGRAAGIEPHMSSWEQVTPSIQRERELRVAPRWVPPEPVAQVMEEPAAPCSSEAGCEPEAAPEISAEVPLPLPSEPVEVAAPGDPVPAGALAFRCALLERPLTEQVIRTESRYERPIWQLVTGLVVVFQAVVATQLLGGSRSEPDPRERALAIGVGSAVALDTLGLIALAFHPPEKEERRFEREGTWVVNAACPDDLWLRSADAEVRILPDGMVESGYGAWALDEYAQVAPRLGLRWGEQEIDAVPDGPTRCRWARDAGVVPRESFCRQPKDAPLSLVAFPRPLSIRTDVPR